MRLSDLVDLEVQLALDESQDEASLRARDRALYTSIPEANKKSPPQLLSAWLEALRARTEGPRVGERVTAAQRVLSTVLALAGLSVGWGLSEGLLHFEQGGAPVNVGYYLLVMVLGQLASLALLGLALLLHHFSLELPLLGDVMRVLRLIIQWFTKRLRSAYPTAAQQLQREHAAYLRARTRLGLYRRLEDALLLSATQLFALCFNLGALICCVRLIVFSDIAFAWNTSLTSLTAEDVRQLCSALAAPFSWLVPDAVPSQQLIEQTRYFRLEGRFAEAALGTRGDPRLAAEWWKFLVACTITYGLLPRVFTYAWFRARVRRSEKNAPLDTPAVLRVISRLASPALITRPDQSAVQATEPAKAWQPVATDAKQPVALLLYRDIPTQVDLLREVVCRHLDADISGVHQVGGLRAADDERVRSLVTQSGSSVALIAEAWEAPDKSLRNLLAELRRSLGPRRSLRVLLIGEASTSGFAEPSAEDVRMYRDRLSLLEDPYLLVETLNATSREPQHMGGQPS